MQYAACTYARSEHVLCTEQQWMESAKHAACWAGTVLGYLCSSTRCVSHLGYLDGRKFLWCGER